MCPRDELLHDIKDVIFSEKQINMGGPSEEEH